MAALCRNTDCLELDVPKWDGLIDVASDIVCGQCGQICVRDDSVSVDPLLGTQP